MGLALPAKRMLKQPGVSASSPSQQAALLWRMGMAGPGTGVMQAWRADLGFAWGEGGREVWGEAQWRVEGSGSFFFFFFL